MVLVDGLDHGARGVAQRVEPLGGEVEAGIEPRHDDAGAGGGGDKAGGADGEVPRPGSHPAPLQEEPVHHQRHRGDGEKVENGAEREDAAGEVVERASHARKRKKARGHQVERGQEQNPRHGETHKNESEQCRSGRMFALRAKSESPQQAQSSDSEQDSSKREPVGRPERPVEESRLERAEEFDADERPAKEHAENEGDRHVLTEEGADHRDGQHRGAEKQVTKVRRDHEADIGLAEHGEHDHVAQREEQRDRVDAERGEVLAQHDLKLRRRQREEQFVRAMPPLVGPRAHRHGRAKEDQDEREPLVERIHVCEARLPEALRPELRQRTHQDEERDEDVARRAGEVAHDVALEDRGGRFHRAAPVSWWKTSSRVGPSASKSLSVPSKAIRPRWMKRMRSATASTS